MIDSLHLILSFSIGIVSGFLPCCFVCYPGLFAFFSAVDSENGEKPSRMRTALIILAFSGGILLVGAILLGGLLSVGLEALRSVVKLGQVGANYAGWAVLTIIGISYIVGKGLNIPVPRISVPQRLTNSRGYRGGFFYGVFMGGPGQAHCTVTLLIPIVFLSLAALDPISVIWYFALFSVGRMIPIFIAGLMLQDMRLRFVRSLSHQSKLIDRVIGVIFLIGGAVLYFWL